MIETLLASSWSTLITLWLIILFASVIRAFTVFGFALCAVLGFLFLLSPSDSVVLSVMLTLGISVLTLLNYRNDYVFDSMLMMPHDFNGHYDWLMDPNQDRSKSISYFGRIDRCVFKHILVSLSSA